MRAAGLGNGDGTDVMMVAYAALEWKVGSNPTGTAK